MSLADREEARPSLGQGLPCPMAAALARLEPEDRETLTRWLEQPVGLKGRRSSRQIAEDLSEELGIPLGDYQVDPHRRRACRCFRGVPK